MNRYISTPALFAVLFTLLGCGEKTGVLIEVTLPEGADVATAKLGSKTFKLDTELPALARTLANSDLLDDVSPGADRALGIEIRVKSHVPCKHVKPLIEEVFERFKPAQLQLTSIGPRTARSQEVEIQSAFITSPIRTALNPPQAREVIAVFIRAVGNFHQQNAFLIDIQQAATAPVNTKQATQLLNHLAEGGAFPTDRPVQVYFDGELQFQYVVEMMNAVKASNFTNITWHDQMRFGSPIDG